jgi:hypothetical protein
VRLSGATSPSALVLAAEVAEDRGRPIELDTALRLLALVAVSDPGHYDAWALRWLGRWLAEVPGATIDAAAEVAAQLADLPAEPAAFDVIQQATRAARRR